MPPAAEVVEAAAPEHRRLPLRFRVALDLEKVELRVRPDPDESQPPHGRILGAKGLRAEHLAVEADEPLGTPSQYRNVVEAVEKHGDILDHVAP